MLVDLREVSHPKYRAELKAAGVKPSPVNSKLFGSPGIGDGSPIKAPKVKPPRFIRPRASFAPPLVGAAGFVYGPLVFNGNRIPVLGGQLSFLDRFWLAIALLQ